MNCATPNTKASWMTIPPSPCCTAKPVSRTRTAWPCNSTVVANVCWRSTVAWLPPARVRPCRRFPAWRTRRTGLPPKHWSATPFLSGWPW